MKLIKASYEILTKIDRDNILKSIEKAGRTCYKSEDKITVNSASEFVKNIIKSGHESVIEHENISVRFIIDRGISHELVRHRLCSFSQESTRYCNYSKNKYKGHITFILPPWIEDIELPYEYDEIDHLLKTFNIKDYRVPTIEWLSSLHLAESTYLKLLEFGWVPQQARSVLPNSLKTEIVTTANLREWRHIFKLRTSPKAHPQIREVMVPLQKELYALLPEIF